MSRSSTLAALAALSLGTLGACGGGAGGERIVLITLDTLRWDAFAGSPTNATAMPRLAEWARDGAVFERYYSATSTTQPTHATLFTGLHPWEHGVPFNGAVLAAEHRTLAEQLQDAGFYTAAAIASFPVHSQFGWDQGFYQFLDDFTQGDTENWSGVEVQAEGFFSEAGHIVEQAERLLDRAEGDRQFFWFHMYDPHAPYGDSGKGKGHLSPRDISSLIEEGEAADAVIDRARRAYDKDVKYMDRQLAKLFELLDADTGFRTHVVIVSDHGESFGEGGSLGHGKRLTPEQIHVPLLIKGPDVVPGVRSEPVGTIDVTATLLALAGIDEGLPPGGRDLRGETVSPGVVMGMRRTFPQKPYYEHRIDGSVVKIDEDARRFFLVEDGTIYAGGTDPVSIDDSEQPLADRAKAAELQELFDSFSAAFNAVGFKEIDNAETLEKLKAMGYIGDDEDH